MRYDNDAYRSVFPKEVPVEQPVIVESPVETFKPTETAVDTKTVEPEANAPIEKVEPTKGLEQDGTTGTNEPDT